VSSANSSAMLCAVLKMLQTASEGAALQLRCTVICEGVCQVLYCRTRNARVWISLKTKKVCFQTHWGKRAGACPFSRQSNLCSH
jgi:hypothetical protein